MAPACREAEETQRPGELSPHTVKPLPRRLEGGRSPPTKTKRISSRRAPTLRPPPPAPPSRHGRTHRPHLPVLTPRAAAAAPGLSAPPAAAPPADLGARPLHQARSRLRRHRRSRRAFGTRPPQLSRTARRLGAGRCRQAVAAAPLSPREPRPLKRRLLNQRAGQAQS